MVDFATMLRNFDVPSDTLSLVFSDHQAPIYALPVPQFRTLALWQQLRAVAASTNYWPLIIGHPNSLEDFRLLRRHESQSWQDILQEAQEYDAIDDLLACENFQRRMLRTAFRDLELNRTRPNLTHYPTDTELEHYLDDYYMVLATDTGRDPDEYLASVTASGTDASPIREAPVLTDEDPNCLLLVPTTENWKVPAYLYLRNGDGPPASLVRMLHRWSEQYGAELIAARQSFIELYLTRLPFDQAHARRIVWEITVFADQPEAIYDIEEHTAQMLQGQRFWSLWWD